MLLHGARTLDWARWEAKPLASSHPGLRQRISDVCKGWTLLKRHIEYSRRFESHVLVTSLPALLRCQAGGKNIASCDAMLKKYKLKQIWTIKPKILFLVYTHVLRKYWDQIYTAMKTLWNLPTTNHGNESHCLYGRNYLTIKRVHNKMMLLALADQQETMEKLWVNWLSYEKDLTHTVYNTASYLLTP